MEKSEQGIIRSTIDCGSVVQVFIETDDGTRVLAADGNMFRRAQEGIGKTSLAGLRIAFEETEDWSGGLAWFAVIEDGHVRCRNCAKHIPPHLNPDYCVFGKHPLRQLPPTNGVHAHE